MKNKESKALNLYFHRSVDEIHPLEWNNLSGTSNPFIRHEYLAALEHHQCVGEKFGWFPYHIAVRDSDNSLVGACPLYIKTNSYGEFVFDWSWASAYEQSGLQYYPKMVCAIPYNPVTGPRLLSGDENIKKLMIRQMTSIAEQHHMSGMHWLFTDANDTALFRDSRMALRLGCQYHWNNQAYTTFEDFLSTFTSRKRKKVKRERRMVAEQKFHFETIHGDEATSEQIQIAHQFYENTFERKSGIPTLSNSFFMEICRTMGEQIVFIFALRDNEQIACAITFKGKDTLYGRFWGCKQDFHSLHFETCFYQGINYCIENQLNTFEPGAQGEHKIARGFLPTKTWSAHWMNDSPLQEAIYTFCQREQQAMQQQCHELLSLSPYKTEE